MGLRDYLSTRRSELEAQLKALTLELSEIQLAEEAIRTINPLEASPVFSGSFQTKAIVRRSSVRAGSIKDWILKALNEYESGLETDDVIRCIEAMGGPEVSRSSITPQLSRLKAANVLTQDGRLWKLKLSDLKNSLQQALEAFQESASEPSVFDDDDEDVIG